MRRLYEGIIFIKPTLTEEEVKAMCDKVKEFIESGGGKFLEDKGAEKQNVPYEIKGVKDVFYYYVKFEMEPSEIEGLAGKIRLSENIVRHMIAKAEEPKEEPKKEKEGGEAGIKTPPAGGEKPEKT